MAELLSSSVQLVDVFVAELKFRLNQDYGWDDEQLRYSIESDTTAAISDDRESVTGTLRATIKWHRGQEPEQIEGPFELEIGISGRFDWAPPDLTDEDIRGWVEFNTQHLLWPYFRSEVSRITSSAGLPTLHIYTIKVPQLRLDAPDSDDAGEMEPEPVDPASQLDPPGA